MAFTLNCSVAPVVTVAEAGEIDIPFTVTGAGVTVNCVELLNPSSEPVMFVLPEEMPVAAPAELTVATAGFDDFHVIELVTFALDPSLYVPMAVNCCVPSTAMLALAGVSPIALSVFVDPESVDEAELLT